MDFEDDKTRHRREMLGDQQAELRLLEAEAKAAIIKLRDLSQGGSTELLRNINICIGNLVDSLSRIKFGNVRR